MNPYFGLFWYLVVAFLLGLFFSIGVISKIVRIRKTRTYWISALPDTGQVEVFGKASGEFHNNPQNGTECVFWHVIATQMQGSAKKQTKVTVYVELSKKCIRGM
jgi:hypothetical protein